MYNNIQCAPVEIIEAPVPPRTLKNGCGFGDQYDWYSFKNGITHAEASGKPVFVLIHAHALVLDTQFLVCNVLMALMPYYILNDHRMSSSLYDSVRIHGQGTPGRTWEMKSLI